MPDNMSFLPWKVPSGYFLTDVVLELDRLLQDKLLQGPQSKLQIAADEGVKLKRLIQAVRNLWRSSPCGNHPRVTELKQILRPSPAKQLQIVTQRNSEFWKFTFILLGTTMFHRLPKEFYPRENFHRQTFGGMQANANDSDAETPSESGPARRDDIEMQMPADNESVDAEDHPPLEDMSQETLALGENSSSDEMSDDGQDDFSPKGDSQRPDAWMSGAFMEVAKMDRAERTVVPVDVLYSWFVDGSPSPTEYCGTFSQRDVRYFDINKTIFSTSWTPVILVSVYTSSL